MRPLKLITHSQLVALPILLTVAHIWLVLASAWSPRCASWFIKQPRLKFPLRCPPKPKHSIHSRQVQHRLAQASLPKNLYHIVNRIAASNLLNLASFQCSAEWAWRPKSTKSSVQSSFSNSSLAAVAMDWLTIVAVISVNALACASVSQTRSIKINERWNQNDDWLWQAKYSYSYIDKTLEKNKTRKVGDMKE